MEDEQFENILNEFKKLYEINISQPTLPPQLPQFSEQVVFDLCQATKDRLVTYPKLIEITGNCFIIGDLHGNIFDLMRIMTKITFPLQNNLIFLGDYVDRGHFSVEVVVFLFALYCKFPDKVILLRGNHELPDMNGSYGFQDEIIELYQRDALWYTFNNVFSYMPFGCLINQNIFCVHGGISSNLKTLDQILELPPSVVNCQDEMIYDLLWSDPSSKDIWYEDSPRGKGHLFGEKALRAFLTENHLTTLIRGHQCVQQGIETQYNNALITVFSSSFYCNLQPNLCGVLYVDSKGSMKTLRLSPKNSVTRQEVEFMQVTLNNHHSEAIKKVPKMDSLALLRNTAALRARARKRSFNSVNLVLDKNMKRKSSAQAILHQPLQLHQNSVLADNQMNTTRQVDGKEPLNHIPHPLPKKPGISRSKSIEDLDEAFFSGSPSKF